MTSGPGVAKWRLPARVVFSHADERVTLASGIGARCRRRGHRATGPDHPVKSQLGYFS